MLEGIAFSKSLPDTIVNIEEKSRSNLFAWRGQFSPQLIESLLRAYGDNDAKIFDPFLGSGTVLYEAGLLGMHAAGCEINPAAASFASIYELINVSITDRTKALDTVERFIAQHTVGLQSSSDKAVKNFEINLLDFYNTNPSHLAKKILRAFIIGLDIGVKSLDLKRISRTWAVLREKIEGLPFSKKKLQCFEADARSVPIKGNKFNFVLTSPPYINVFNYHQNYRQSVELLGEDVLTVAQSEIGANRKFRSNRFMTVVQYCMDMAQVFVELRRICEADSKIIFIVGRESNVRMTAFRNAEILTEVAKACGLRLVGQQHRSFGNKFGQRIYEEILRFQFSKRSSHGDFIEKARLIGIHALQAAIEYADKEQASEIKEVLERAQAIRSSPLLGV